MAQQLGLDLEGPPETPRASTPNSYHVRSHQTVAEVQAGESRAAAQDTRVLEVFRARGRGRRLTPSRVHGYMCDECGPRAPLLTSIRRALTNLTRRGLLVHYKGDRKDGPRGATESTWGLA
jgi:hypothetical protein